MKKRWYQFKTLSFTMLSNDVNNNVKRFRIPKIIIPIFILLFIITSLVLFVYFFQESKQLAHENKQLTDSLDDQTVTARALHTEVNEMKTEKTEFKEQLNTLYELESQVKESIKDLPVDIDHSGGIDLNLTEQEAVKMKEDSSNLNLQTDVLINRYQNTLDVMRKTNDELVSIPTEWPVKPNKITSKFGLRTDPFRQTSSYHTGVDIRGDMGDPVFAAANGKVIRSEFAGGHGNLILIQHSDKFETMYAHLSKFDVEVGDEVKKGDVIGAVGSTGRSTGPHLHYEINEFGKPIDPYTYLYIFDQYEKGK